MSSNITSEVQVTLAGAEDPEDETGKGNWLVIEQKAIPEEQEVATIEDFNAGIRQLESGQSAHTAFTGQCPVSYGPGVGQYMVYTTITFYVHRSVDIDPEIEVTLGGEVLDVTGPAQGFVSKGDPWIFDKNKTQSLGWRPYNGVFQHRWEIAFDPETAQRIMNPALLPGLEQDDGIIYLIGADIVGSLWVSGLADVDVYKVRVGQAAGTKWQGGLYATAWWPAGVERDDQQHVTEELFLPSCVIEKIEECANDQDGEDGEGGGAGPRVTLDIIGPPVYLDVGACTGEVLGKTPNSEAN